MKDATQEDTLELKAVRLVKSSYPANGKHIVEWYQLEESINDDTPIARAWRRISDRGIVIGPPVTPEIEMDGVTTQYFLYAKATLTQHYSNGNIIVVFSDARGTVGMESGL